MVFRQLRFGRIKENEDIPMLGLEVVLDAMNEGQETEGLRRRIDAVELHLRSRNVLLKKLRHRSDRADRIAVGIPVTDAPNPLRFLPKLMCAVDEVTFDHKGRSIDTEKTATTWMDFRRSEVYDGIVFRERKSTATR